MYQQVTNNAGLTLFLLIVLVILSVIALIGYISASIRLLYGFARNGAFTNAEWWGKVDTKHNIPINVLYVSTAATLVLGFVYLASPVGFQILLGSAQALFGKFLRTHAQPITNLVRCSGNHVERTSQNEGTAPANGPFLCFQSSDIFLCSFRMSLQVDGIFTSIWRKNTR